MSNALTECCSGIFAICCITISSTLTNWSTTSRAGSGGCCTRGQAGCCGSCFGDSFNRDAFDDDEEQDKNQTRAVSHSADHQPTYSTQMTAPTSASAPVPIPVPVSEAMVATEAEVALPVDVLKKDTQNPTS